jgi:hypothetical protein
LGLLETLMGLVVFVIIAFVGTKAFKGVVANQKEAAQLKALTDAVATTAELLSTKTVKALTESGSAYLSWSEPAVIGNGEFWYRYRTSPKPTISGTCDTSVVGLEVETGSNSGGAFKPSRSFATLIGPHVSSRDRLGAVSTAAERAAEAQNYSNLQARIRDVSQAAVGENQIKLNSYSCYARGECCDFMERYFKDPSMNPGDGMDEKCFYRCALAGDVKVTDWNKSCGKDFCAIAPWRTKEDCCKAIAEGSCKPGSVCANICIDCVGENGSTCNSKVSCNDDWFNDFFDCTKGTYCNGNPLPDYVPEWGNVKVMCKTAECAAIPPSCDDMLYSCCTGYWQRLAMGEEPWPGTQFCPTQITKDQCCGSAIGAGYYNFQCSTDGKIISAQYYNKGTVMCGAPPGTDWDKYCKVMQGCPSVYNAGFGSCGSWAGLPTSDPWIDPDPSSGGVHGFGNSGPTSGTSTGGGPTTSAGGGPRNGSTRGGDVHGSKGGRE